MLSGGEAMKRLDWFNKVLLTLIAAGLWVLILRPVLWPGAVRAAEDEMVPVTKVVRAERFELADAKGKVHATLRLDGMGGPHLELLYKDGKPGLGMSIWEQGPNRTAVLGLSGKGQEGLALATWLPDGEGGPGLLLTDKDGNVAGGLAIGGAGPMLALIGKPGQPHMVLALNDLGGAALKMFDSHDRERVALRLLKDGGPTLELRGEDQKVTWKAP
jgi:hypothetical protein